MVGDTCDDNLLIVPFNAGQKLNEQCNAAAVDVSFFIAFQNNFPLFNIFNF